MDLSNSIDEKSQVLDEIRILTKEYIDLVFKDSSDSSKISSLVATSLTSTNTKIVEALTSDKQIEPEIAKKLLAILETNNNEFLKTMEQRNVLEEKRIQLIESTIKLHKLRLKNF